MSAGVCNKILESNNVLKALYTNKPSYYPGDTVKIFLDSHLPFEIEKEIIVSDIQNNVKKRINVDLTNTTSNSNPWVFGYGLKKYYSFILPDDFQSGVYFIQRVYPFVVKSKKNNKVNIVVPYFNDAIYSGVDKDQKIYSQMSLCRSIQQGSDLLSFKKYIASMKSEFELGFVTDFDLEDQEVWKQSKVLIFYGKSTFWSKKMIDNWSFFVNNGGKSLVMCEYFMNNICWLKAGKNLVEFSEDLNENLLGYKNWDDVTNTEFTLLNCGVSYKYGGFAKQDRYTILDQNHLLFKGIDNLSLSGGLYASSKMRDGSKNQEEIDFEKKILASGRAYFEGKEGSKEIIELNFKKGNGVVLHLGSGDWFRVQGEESVGVTKKLLHNGINYLLSLP